MAGWEFSFIIAFFVVSGYRYNSMHNFVVANTEKIFLNLEKRVCFTGNFLSSIFSPYPKVWSMLHYGSVG